MADLPNPSGKIFLVLAVIAVVVSLFSVGLLYLSVGNLVTVLSGRAATSTGEANLTVETITSINFTTRAINFGSGRVNDGSASAYLDVNAGTVVRGNWTAVAGALSIQNIGNLNVSLNLSVTKTAATFIGGTSPVYQWNVTNSEASSCVNLSGGSGNNLSHLGVYYNPNTTSANWCPLFQFIDSKDQMNISFNLTVPSDSITGALGDVVTATALALP